MTRLLAVVLVSGCARVGTKPHHDDFGAQCGLAELTITAPAPWPLDYVETETGSAEVWFVVTDGSTKAVLQLERVQGTFLYGQPVRTSKYDYSTSRVLAYACKD